MSTSAPSSSSPHITPHFSSTYPPSQALQDLEPLLKPTGKWTLSPDGKGIERSFKFKGFKKCWEFMNAISPICVKEKHHPEWSNVYNTAFVRWTTHQPEGLSELDVRMARVCDGVAESLGEVVVVDEGGEGGLGRELAERVTREAGEGCCVPKGVRKKEKEEGKGEVV